MDTCLNWKSEELQKLAEQVGVQATPAFADKVGLLMDKIGIAGPVNYPLILEEDEIISGRIDKRRVAANYNYEEGVIRIDKALLKQKFEEKAWTKPKKLIQMLHGKQVESYAQALPEDAFKTYEEFEKFVIEHEYQHSLYTRKDFQKEYPDGTEGDYETIINNNATKALATRTPTSLPTEEKTNAIEAIRSSLSQLPANTITESQINEIIDYANKFDIPLLIYKGLDGKKNIDGSLKTIHSIPNTSWGTFSYKDALSYARETGNVAMFIEEGKNLENLPDVDGKTPISEIKDVETDMIVNSTSDIVTIPRNIDPTKTPQVIMKGDRKSIGILNKSYPVELSLNKNNNRRPQLPSPQQVKDYLEKNKPVKPVTTTIKPGVAELFESNPELANAVYEALGFKKDITTQQKQQAQQLYSQYLSTIFPDSKVKDIIYRRSPRANVEKFYKRERKEGFDQPGISSITKEYIDRIKDFGEHLYAILVDIQNPFVTERDYDLLETGEGSQEKGYDGIISNGGEINVFEPEQIHILGSKQDIKGFSKFAKEQPKKESRKRLAHAEVLLPAWMSSFFGPEFRTADNTVDFDKLNKMIGERGFKGLGYRIPTEDKYSLLPIKVIRFLPESGGGAIMLPAEITTIAGSDFDVDKMYTIFKNMRQFVNKDGQTEFKVIEYLDNSNSTVEERWKIVANTKPEVRAVKDKYSEAIEAAQKTLDRSIKIQRDKLDKLKTEKKSQEDIINDLTDEIDILKQERELLYDSLESVQLEINHLNDSNATAEQIQESYDIKSRSVGQVKYINAKLDELYTKRAELSGIKYKKEDVNARYEKKNDAFQKYLKAKNDVIADMWKEVDTVFPLKDFEESPMAEQNTRQARDNHKLDLMLTVMSSEHTTLSVLSPGGYDYLKNTVMANIIKNKGGVKKAKNIFSLNDIDMMTLQNLAGKALVGIAANHNKHHTLRQWSNLSLVNPVLFDNRSFVSLHDKEAYSVDGSQRTITRNLAEILAAVVDNAKDPVANVLNYNEHTADLISMLIGTGADINTVFSFVNQPIFTQAMELLNTRKEKNLVDAIKKAAEMNELTLPVDSRKIKARNLNLNDLNRNMTKFNKGFQYEVAISALAYIKQSKDLGLLIRASKADTAGIGQRVEDGVYLEAQINDAKEIKTINGVNEFIGDFSRFTKMFTEYGVSKPLSILEEMYPYGKEEFKQLKNNLELIIPGELSSDDRQEINRAYIQYKMHDFGYYKYANREAIVKNTPALLAQIKDKYPDLKESNYLIRYLQVNYGNKDAGMPIIEFPNSLTSSEEQVNKSKQSWKEMFNESARQNLIDFINTKIPEKQRVELIEKTNNFTDLIKVWNDRNLFQSEEAKQVLKDFVLDHLANSLIRYSFFTTGHEFTPTSIKQLIPVDVYMNLKDDSGVTIGKYENMLLQQADNINYYRNFIDQFIRHRYDLPKYVARVADDKSNISSYNSKTDTIIVGKDKLKVANPLIAEELVVGTLTEIVPTSEYIAIKDNDSYKLYKAVAPMTEDGYSIEDQVVFERIEALGISNRVEYSTDIIEKSLYKKNNVVPPSSQPPAAPVPPTPVAPVKDPEGVVTNKDTEEIITICTL